MKTKSILLAACFLIFTFSCRQKSTDTQQPVAQQPVTAVQPPDYLKMINARVFIKPGMEEAFINAAKVMIENSNKEEGCTGYMLYQDPYEKTNFIFVERYKNQAAIDFHFNTSYFKEFGTKSADMTSKPMEIKIFDIAGEK